MKRILGVAVAALAMTLMLTGCEPTAAEQLQERVKLAKICTDGGGVYTHDDWFGYRCDFEH